jgi:hypothetical protein
VNTWMVLGFFTGIFLVFNLKQFPGIWHVSNPAPPFLITTFS